jgi:NitT/TauT family transport system substrate-binding protein
MQRNQKKLSTTRFFLLASLLFTLLAGFGLWSCSRSEESRKMENMKIGAPPLEQNALIYIADDKRLFARNGLNIAIKDYDSGVTAVDGMLKGEVGIAEAAEFPFVRTVFQKEQICIIACNDKFENDYIVGRKDRGINKVSDLKGKRIGVSLKTINEFYLGRFLGLNGIDMKDIVPVDTKPGQFVDALAGGGVDALIAWQPYISRILEKEGNRAVVWPAQSGQAVYGVLVCSRGWLTQRADAVKRFLKSLAEAEDYLFHHPDEAKAIVRKRLKYEDSYMARIWPQHRFSLSLDQTLIVAMKDEAQWMIKNNLTSEKTIPDFMDNIYLDGLMAVRPEAVSIIR